MRRLLLLSCFMFLACGRHTGPDYLFDADAQNVIDTLWSGATSRLLMGKITVTTGDNDFQQAKISEEEFREVKAWAQAGLIELRVSDLTKNFSGWNNWLSLSEGARKKIEVTPTEKGLKAQESSKLKSPPDQRFLQIRFYDREVSRIISNDSVKKNVDAYRVVKGTCKTSWTELGSQVFSIRGWPMPPESNFIALFKYDPFTAQWKLVSFDMADSDSNFKSSNVEQYLARVPG